MGPQANNAPSSGLPNNPGHPTLGYRFVIATWYSLRKFMTGRGGVHRRSGGGRRFSDTALTQIRSSACRYRGSKLWLKRSPSGIWRRRTPLTMVYT
jgi:hypothetical protein